MIFDVILVSPHGNDPLLFQRSEERPLDTVYGRDQACQPHHLPALARPVLRRAGRTPGQRQGGSEVGNFHSPHFVAFIMASIIAFFLPRIWGVQATFKAVLTAVDMK